MSRVEQNLAYVHKRIADACVRSGRTPASVTLIGVTKTVPPDTIRQAVALGLREFGENRVQEARSKQRALGIRSVRWHLIGHLQRNKAKHAAELFDLIHSVDSAELAEELDRHAAARHRALEVFVQVNVSGEATKSGCQPDDALDLARRIGQRSHLSLVGVMTIAPLADDPEAARPHFAALRRLRDAMADALHREPSSLKLSMGMSQDFEVAIEEGADLIRVGTAIFKGTDG